MLKEKENYIQKLILEEELRQKSGINLIASENYVPFSIRSILGSVLTHKYAEGYPGKRFYGGCDVVDKIENYAIDSCKGLFEAEHANVQAHSGTQANMAIYSALINPGDKILGMDFGSGGHLSHGQKVSFSGVFYRPVFYEVNSSNERLEYDSLYKLAEREKPKIIIAGSSAYSRVIDFQKIKKIADEVGAFLVADIAHLAGLMAAKLYPSPVPFADAISGTTQKTLRGPRGGFLLTKRKYQKRIDRAVFPFVQGGPFMNVIAAKGVAFELAAKPEFAAYQRIVLSNAKIMANEFRNLGYRIVSDGTDVHFFLLDLTEQKITGDRAERVLNLAGIYVNRNCIPFDKKSPAVASGIRIGTSAISSLGMKENEIKLIAELADRVLKSGEDEKKIGAIKSKVKLLVSNFTGKSEPSI